ncbi:MAG: hypothetical protein V3T72_08615 [Thermoanaerobaculia bacterium]
MAENEEWAERKRRMVKCKKHGLHYDPKMASGCTLCLKEKTEIPQRPPQVTIILLCILGMAFAIFHVFGPDSPGDEEEPLLGPAPDAVQASKLDPEPYRQPIEALERALFTEIDNDLDLAGAGVSIAYSTRNLSAEIRRQGPEYAALDADTIENMGQNIAEAFTYAGLEKLKSDWLRARQRVFSPASWFATPALAGTRSERIAINEYNALAGNLQALIEEGAAEAQSYVDSADFPDRDQHWQDFQADWRQRLGALWQHMPARPGAEADPRILVAIQQLENAFQTTWGLPSGSGFLQSGNPTLLFDPALKQVEKARQTLAEVRP